MASQILHDLIDELENAISPVKGLVANAEAKISAALSALRAHAEADGQQLLADTETAAHTLGAQAVADAAPVIADVKADAADLAQTAQSALSGGVAGSEPQPGVDQASPAPEPAA